VHVPSPEDEDQRQLHRDLMALKAEQTHHINRLKGLLASQGVALPSRRIFSPAWRRCSCGTVHPCHLPCMPA